VIEVHTQQASEHPGRAPGPPAGPPPPVSIQPAGQRPALASEARVSVVIPALNEADNLPHVLPHIPHWVHEVILVDGFSTDGTADVAKRLLPSIRSSARTGPARALRFEQGSAPRRVRSS
jgi:hypothetical protein